MASVLDRISGPQDLKGLTSPELAQLAREVRERLVSTVSANGGHLASNLGGVELTIALHRAFRSPEDKILWDVGHQCYVHKLLTGRNQSFASLRQWGGISGFPEPQESPHDIVAVGHASTSISSALGLALARDLAGAKHHVVAVIGDGALTGGQAFEALNHAGHLGTRLIVVLNDNAMAISPSVGALAHSLNRIRLSPSYHEAKEGLGKLLPRLPLGGPFWSLSKRLKKGVKGLIVPTMLFEELGFDYIGPIDGHDIDEVEEALLQAQRLVRRPALVHVLTQKGKGYTQAERDPVAYHGLSPTRPAQATEPDSPTYTQVFAQTMARLMAAEPKVVAITAAMPEGTGLSQVITRFPSRVFDVGICEPHAVTLAAGLASQGLIPVVAIYSTFLQRAFDQILQDVCLQELPVVFAIDRGGLVGEDGKTHQGSFDLSYLGLAPNLVVAAPADENELQHLLYTAVKAGKPMAVRYPRGRGPGRAREPAFRELPIGQGVMVKPGPDATIVALGSAVAPSLEASRLLEGRGLRCGVINARYVKPLDTELILREGAVSRRVLTVEENVLLGGFGSVVRAALAVCPGIRVECLGLPDKFIEHGPQGLLRAKYSLDGPGIARRLLVGFPELERLPLS
ncbi:MAG: 1-deoxy-D-xylulose-5-phosphate synthase [Chloroflexi bacterium]|nr:1-deoxy-D-xylulose-5-phosphate synthase [Chloroflexota bacterium]